MICSFLCVATLTMIGASSVLAEEGNSVSSKSNAYVGIEKNDGSEGESPVSPIDPSQPVTPPPTIDGEENPHAPSTKGPLSINYISNLRFGMNKASGNDMEYLVKPDEVVNEEGMQIQVPNYIQITDHRGTNAGWILTVKQNGPFVNGAHELLGTEMNFRQSVAVGKSGTTSTSPSVNANFSLTADGQEVMVMTAQENQGMGTWIDRFGDNTENAPNSIVLKVPGDTKKIAGKYTTSLTWTLSDVPNTD